MMIESCSVLTDHAIFSQNCIPGGRSMEENLWNLWLSCLEVLSVLTQNSLMEVMCCVCIFEMS